MPPSLLHPTEQWGRGGQGEASPSAGSPGRTCGYLPRLHAPGASSLRALGLAHGDSGQCLFVALPGTEDFTLHVNKPFPRDPINIS